MSSSDENPANPENPENPEDQGYQIPSMSTGPATLANQLLTVELTGAMSFKLFGASQKRGQTPEEFVRSIIGEYCQNEPEPIPSGLDLPERGAAPGPGNMLDDLMPHMGKYLRLMQAALGSFSCPGCTQRVSEKAALAGTCANCDYEFGSE